MQASFGSWRGDGDGVEWGNETRTVVDEVLLHSLSNMQRSKESQKGKNNRGANTMITTGMSCLLMSNCNNHYSVFFLAVLVGNIFYRQFT